MHRRFPVRWSPLAMLLSAAVMSTSTSPGQEGEARSLTDLRDVLFARIQQIDFSKLPEREAIDLHLAVSDAYQQSGKSDQANEHFQQAVRRAGAGEMLRYQFQLFAHALKLKNWHTASSIASQSSQPTRFQDRLAIEKYRVGVTDTLEGIPHSKLDFYIAMDIADAYAKRRQYDQLETFVTSIKKLPSNEPTDVGGITWENVAIEFREQGDKERALEFIEKSMQLAGNNYYTGYGIRVTRLSLRGELKDEAEAYAKRAVAYRGHHTRELLGQLIRELVAAGHVELAQKSIEYYPTPEERLDGEAYLARHLARHGFEEKAIQWARQIDDPLRSANALMYVAEQLANTQQVARAKFLASEAMSQTDEQSVVAPEYEKRRHIQLLARLNLQQRVVAAIDAAPSATDAAQRAAAAIVGISQRRENEGDQ